MRARLNETPVSDADGHAFSTLVLTITSFSISWKGT